MQAKYLPIGSVVTINDANKKVMIIGYYSIKYMNVVKMYDYVGCVYPEGLLLPNDLYSFNHSDIINVDYMGYESEAYKVLNDNLTNKKNDTKFQQGSNSINMKFDKNGVVVYDELPEIKIDSEIVDMLDSIEVENPFVSSPIEETKSIVSKPIVVEKKNENNKIDETNFFKIDSNEETNKKDQDSMTAEIPHYQFDEYGFVINDSDNKKEEPTPSKDTKQKPEKKEDYQMPHYRFDENGVIISE